jgi:hypothetical protein
VYADAFVGEQGVADPEYEHFHGFNVAARYPNNNQATRPKA